MAQDDPYVPDVVLTLRCACGKAKDYPIRSASVDTAVSSWRTSHRRLGCQVTIETRPFE